MFQDEARCAKMLAEVSVFACFGHYSTIKSQSARPGSLVERSSGLGGYPGFTLTGPPVKQGSPFCVPVNLTGPLKFI